MAESKPPPRIALKWAGGHSFSAENASGVALTLDGDAGKGFSPAQALLASLGACMGIDVVMILGKMREGLDELRVEVEGARSEEPPRYFRTMQLRFSITGRVARDRAERAVALSLERYCSVFHTLRRDIAIETSIEVLSPPGA